MNGTRATEQAMDDNVITRNNMFALLETISFSEVYFHLPVTHCEKLGEHMTLQKY